MAGLSLKNIQKVYPNGFHAVKNVDLKIADKEFIVFVGPHGCGKSTILRMMAGLEDISSGDFSMDARRMNDVALKDRDMGMVFQNYVLYPHMSVYDNLAFGLKLHKIPRDAMEKAIRDVARILEIEHLLDCKPQQLSDVQRQRVAMGRALVRNPKVILMDEPLSKLDARLRVQMCDEITKLHQKLGSTIVYVTNDQEEAMMLGDRIVVMKDGTIQQADTPENLYHKPCNLFVAGYIGSPQMNMIIAQLEKRGADVVANIAGQTIVLPADKAAAVTEKGFADKEVVLGIRCENITTGEEASVPAHGNVVSATVTAYELQGADVDLAFDLGEFSVTARVSSTTTYRPGDEAQFVFDLSRMHIFDPESQRVICH